VIFLDTCVLYDIYMYINQQDLADGQELEIMNQKDTVYLVTKTPFLATGLAMSKLINNTMFGKIIFLDDCGCAPNNLTFDGCTLECTVLNEHDVRQVVRVKSTYRDYRGRLEAAFFALIIDV
jgi:hypothetical protein